MEDWKSLKIPRIVDIEQVAAEFQVWSTEFFPTGKVKVRIIERRAGYYWGSPNIAAKERRSDRVPESERAPDWIGGYGNSIAEALEDTIKSLVEVIIANGATSPDDFEWAGW